MGAHSKPLVGSSQEKYPWRATVRTVFQFVIALCAAAPVIIALTGLTATTAGVGTFLVVAAAVTRLMGSPVVNELLSRFAPWLAAEPKG